MLTLQARDAEQEAAFQSLFDRSESYMAFAQTLKEVKALLKKGTDMELRKTLRNAEQQLHDIQVIDFFPGKAYERAANGLATLRRDIDIRLSPGEPSTRVADIQRQQANLYEGKTWATRKRPWVDRLATAWLVLRFVDAMAHFIWIDSPKKCPKSAVGFDFDGATFSHVGDKVTFEVVMHTFGLEADLTLKAIGALVHHIDIGGVPVDEAPGVEVMVRGLQIQHEQDDALLAAAIPFFDTLYAALQSQQ